MGSIVDLTRNFNNLGDNDSFPASADDGTSFCLVDGKLPPCPKFILRYLDLVFGNFVHFGRWCLMCGLQEGGAKQRPRRVKVRTAQHQIWGMDVRQTKDKCSWWSSNVKDVKTHVKDCIQIGGIAFIDGIKIVK
ncbi:eukaryotic translation initiation factor 3 subunit D isoform 1 [Spatholobus suberectus]|nr:eukaryotic translation initiation factor 3 subunit D isoform 1 [Spatholobus suberectus]